MAKKADKPIVIITGSSGRIGTALANALRKSYKIVGFDQDKDACEIPCDITSATSLALSFRLFKEKYGSKIAAVIHLAAYFDFTGEESPLYQSVNVNGTKKLLMALQDFEVERFIYASTMLVHEPCILGEVLNENAPLKPKWPYPKSKLEAEKVIKKYHGKIPYLILRLAGLYDDVTCVPTLANQIARTYEREIKSHLYAGDLNVGQSFIHQKDLIDLFKKALFYRNELSQNEIILAGEPKTVSYGKLQNLIAQLIHGEQSSLYKVPSSVAKAGAWLEYQAEPLIPDDFDQGEKPFIRPFMIDLASDNYALDITRAKKYLHWEPKYSIEETLPKIIDSLKADPESWYKQNRLIQPDWMAAIKHNPEKIRSLYEINFRKQHQQTLWAHFLNMGFGLWLIISPASLGYTSYPLILSDIISGGALLLFASLSLSWRLSSARWVCALIGLWLIFAPLVFWAPTAAAYLNDTLIGALIIGFSVLIRPEIGVAPNAALEGPVIPPGWGYSPSSWFQRLPIIILAYVGFFISQYMAAYQLGHIDHVWEPFFVGYLPDAKNGTEEIITSYVSKAFPVPDAGLGATVYILEILTGIIGGQNRWRTMPWLVLLFGFMIVPLGIVSITFIVIQPILLNTWCTLCLIAAVAMLIQVPYSFDEIIATCIFLWRRWKAGRPLLRIFFVGDSDETTQSKKELDSFEQSPFVILREMLSGGITLPWNLMGCILIGIWLMCTRIVLDTTGPMANSDHLIGCLIITVTITALAETVRILRFLNLFFAVALLITPFIYHASGWGIFASLISGGLLFFLSIPRGKIRFSYGTWDKVIR
ncbi:NAD dependent epimerase/dehydratase [Legionella gratiana]|uniref:NAD dependent epimerase/dehydratase n=1 Tax=Legionella gratiana TaxID=45066 RepID=A0A378JNK9_9GAMM|nr:vitamin K epoxide reductase family protein [Legionella gratiana]KTD12046.1 NAD dependent epimerase/dehydratase [Legionella gratiana]STX46350.1 UDP-glucose 4-epimerase [Legionella gratiana]